MKKLNLALLLLICAACLLNFSSCKPDEPEVPDEEELITTLTYTLVSGASNVVMTYKDLDGDGSGVAEITGGTLVANSTYTGVITLLNESETPVESITEEIEEEDEEHQFFFQTDIAGLSVAYSDMDSNGDPIGLSTTVNTGDVGSGTLTIILKHEPVKDASGVTGGDVTNAAGETDIQVVFPVDVQ